MHEIIRHVSPQAVYSVDSRDSLCYAVLPWLGYLMSRHKEAGTLWSDDKQVGDLYKQHKLCAGTSSICTYTCRNNNPEEGPCIKTYNRRVAGPPFPSRI